MGVVKTGTNVTDGLFCAFYTGHRGRGGWGSSLAVTSVAYVHLQRKSRFLSPIAEVTDLFWDGTEEIKGIQDATSILPLYFFFIPLRTAFAEFPGWMPGLS